MKVVVALAVLMAAAPAVAESSSDDESARSERQRRVCTRIERYSGSRMSFQRVCMTEAEWRERLGPDWRQRLAGRSPEDDLGGLDGRSRDFSNIGSEGLSDTGGTDYPTQAVNPQR